MTGADGRPLRSLHVITSDARRGAETFAVHLVESLRAQGQPARLVALARSESQHPHAVSVLGARRRTVGTFRALRRHARGADVVVAHGSDTLEACAVGIAGTGVPFVYRSIGDPTYWVAPGARRAAVGMLHRRAQRHVALWHGAAEQLASRYRLPQSRIDVVPNAVPAGQFPRASDGDRQRARARLGLAPDASCVAAVGALSTEKDLPSLLAALEGLDVVGLIAGDGPERGALHRKAEAMHGADVRFLGAVEHPGDVYAAADLLVLPSRTEGMPAAVIEAGLTGTPAVATAVGALPEMLDHGRTGFLVQPADPAGLARTIREALPVAREVGARAADEFARCYTIEHVTPCWARVLERAAQRGR